MSLGGFFLYYQGASSLLYQLGGKILNGVVGSWDCQVRCGYLEAWDVGYGELMALAGHETVCCAVYGVLRYGCG